MTIRIQSLGRHAFGQNENLRISALVRIIHAAPTKVVRKGCGKKFDWNDQWPDGLKEVPVARQTELTS
jgi:hypothetical protein